LKDLIEQFKGDNNQCQSLIQKKERLSKKSCWTSRFVESVTLGIPLMPRNAGNAGLQGLGLKERKLLGSYNSSSSISYTIQGWKGKGIFSTTNSQLVKNLKTCKPPDIKRF
jgi:hypothetical protein